MKRQSSNAASAIVAAKSAPVDALIAPKRTKELLDCSRSEVYRIAARAGWTRVYLSDVPGGSVRYRLAEVLEFIERRSVRTRQ